MPSTGAMRFDFDGSMPLPSNDGHDLGGRFAGGMRGAKRGASAAFGENADSTLVGESPRMKRFMGGRSMGGGMPLERNSSLTGLSSSSLNLGMFIRDTSLSDLGLGIGSSELAGLGLSFTKSASELRDVNASELSLSGLLNEQASEIVTGLAKHSESFSLSPGMGGGRLEKKKELLEIMSDFGPGPMPQAA